MVRWKRLDLLPVSFWKGGGEGRISCHCRLIVRYPARLHPRGMKKGSRDSALGSLNDLAEARTKTLRSSVPHLGPGDKIPAAGCPRSPVPPEGLWEAIRPPASRSSPCQVPQPRLQKGSRPVEELAPEKTVAAVSARTKGQATRERPAPGEAHRVPFSLPPPQRRSCPRHRARLEATAALSEVRGQRCP